MYSIYFTVYAIFFIVLLMVVYFYKERVKKIENIFYSGVIITTFLGLLVEVFSAYLVLKVHIDSASFLYQFVVKIIYGLYLFWVSLITLYFISLLRRKKKINAYFLQYTFSIMSFFNILVLFLPLTTTGINGVLLPGGPCVAGAKILSNCYIIVMTLIVIFNGKLISLKERVPLIFTIVLFFADIILQTYAGLFLTNAMCTFIAFIMYFTIENPDVKMLEQVEIAKNQADKANMAKTDFLSSMSHEIRTPLNAIMGFSESLKDKNLEQDALEDVNDIIAASQTLLETVNGILDISKIEANKIEIVESTYNFDKIFNELVVLSKARLGDDKPIEFEYKKSNDIPKYLHGDYARVKQVIINLLTNAIKYTKQGHILFNVNCVNNHDTCRLIIEVEDTGMGIKEENIQKLFNKFERLDNENSSIEGTGLGLAITKKLVELMKGEIRVNSKYGEGSKFTVILDQKIDSTVTNIKEEVTDDNTITITHDLSTKKVLLVDDNNLNLKVASRLLKAYNINAECVSSGFECLDLVNQGNKYDLILMDDMMPKKSGRETFKDLKQNPNFNMPVVVLTANAIEGMKEEYLKEGFDGYLAKPIVRDELNEIIKEYLDK